MSFFYRMRGKLSGNQADVNPHEWRLPSSYPPSKSSASGPVIPNPRVFQNAFIPDDPTGSASSEAILMYPSIGHVAVHLALLECFRNLRLSASALEVDGQIQQPPAYEEKPKAGFGPEFGPAKLPESQKWDLLVRMAITRFAAWWANIDRVLSYAATYSHHRGSGVAVQLTADYLPPLDVLLIWYVLMLNPTAYSAACQAQADRNPKLQLQSLCFPWPAIRQAIEVEKMQFRLLRPAENLFRTLSSQEADILTYLSLPPAYSETSTPELGFIIDLFTEVKLHESFTEEAHDLLWIRAPALRGSLGRASADYVDFQRSGAASESERAGRERPPFGIEIIWRTHRLFPIQYRSFSERFGSTEKSADKSDVDSKAAHANGDAKGTSANAPDEMCLCWTCERIRDDLPSFAMLQTGSPANDTPSVPSSSRATSPSTSPTGLSTLSSDQLNQIQDDLGFYRAVETARRLGVPLPTRPPTAAEKEAERLAKAKQKELGYRPGLGEYLEILPDGKSRIRRTKQVSKWYMGI